MAPSPPQTLAERCLVFTTQGLDGLNSTGWAVPVLCLFTKGSFVLSLAVSPRPLLLLASGGR